MCVLQN